MGVPTDEPRRQHAVHGDDLCRGNPRLAAAVRLGAEHSDLRRLLVGFRASDPCRLDRAVRHVRLGARLDHHRSRQRVAVHRLRGDLDRRARVRRPPGRAGLSGNRRGALAAGLPSAGAGRRFDAARADRLRNHHRLYLAHGLRILARPQRATGVALAGDIHVIRPWRAVIVAHAAGRDAALVADERQHVRQRLDDRAQLRSAAVHHLGRLHPAGDGEGAHRIASPHRRDGRSAHRHRQPPRRSCRMPR